MNNVNHNGRGITHGWRDGSITFPAFLMLLIAMAAGALGAASIGGIGGTLVVAAIMLSVIALLVRWAGAPQ